MARPKVKLNHPPMRALLNSDAAGEHLVGLADKVAAAARSGAPVETGSYRDSIEVQLVHTDRAVARVVATAPHSLVVEAKTGNLARSLDAAGGG